MVKLVHKIISDYKSKISKSLYALETIVLFIFFSLTIAHISLNKDIIYPFNKGHDEKSQYIHKSTNFGPIVIKKDTIPIYHNHQLITKKTTLSSKKKKNHPLSLRKQERFQTISEITNKNVSNMPYLMLKNKRDFVLGGHYTNKTILLKTHNNKTGFKKDTTSHFITKSFMTEHSHSVIESQKIIQTMMNEGILRNVITKGQDWLKERNCLALAIYFEARSEPQQGRWAVAEVIINRVKSKYYPKTICGVVFEGQHRRFKCQFSFACDGISDVPRNRKAWKDAIKMSNFVISGKKRLQRLKGATHYHADYVQPKWAPTLTLIEKIGQHIFYKNHRWG